MSELLVPMKSKKAKQKHPTDKTGPHISISSSLSSRNQTATAEITHTGEKESRVDTAAGVLNIELKLLNNADTDDKLEDSSFQGDLSAMSCCYEASFNISGVSEAALVFQPIPDATQNESLDTLTETESNSNNIEDMKYEIEGTLKEFLQVTSRESISLAKDSLKKAHAKLDEVVEKRRIYFQSILVDTANKADSTTSVTEEKPVICTMNQSCTDLTDDLLQQLPVYIHPSDFCLLKSFIEFGGEVATGVEAITGLRALLEEKRRLTKLTLKLHDLCYWSIDCQRARWYIRAILKRRQLKLGPRGDKFIMCMKSMSKAWLELFQHIAELN